MKPVNLITAICQNNGIGYKGDLPWRLKNEMAYFTRMTSQTKNPQLQNVVLMGRKTWDSVPPKYKPFSKRINAVVSQHKTDFPEGILVYKSIAEAIDDIQSKENVESIWIIGGYGAYKEALDKKLCDKLFITRILQEFECDAFFPEFNLKDYSLVEEPGVSSEVQEEKGIRYEFKVYQKL